MTYVLIFAGCFGTAFIIFLAAAVGFLISRKYPIGVNVYYIGCVTLLVACLISLAVLKSEKDQARHEARMKEIYDCGN